MKSSVWLWVVAVLVTLFAVRYQRMTGPTHPVDGRAGLGGTPFSYSLPRTHAGEGPLVVSVKPGVADATGVLQWSPAGQAPAWSDVPMRREGDALVGEIPHHGMAEKVMYRVELASGDARVTLPPGDPALARFRGDVPASVLLPHIVFMFVAMLLSNRAGLEVLRRPASFRTLVLWTLITLFIGGFVLGCTVSWYGFRMPWGGVPISNDVTDNKTLIAFVAWLAAGVAVLRMKRPHVAVVLAALVTLFVYLIPHSISAKDLYGGGRAPVAAPAVAPAAGETPASAAPDTTPR